MVFERGQARRRHAAVIKSKDAAEVSAAVRCVAGPPVERALCAMGLSTGSSAHLARAVGLARHEDMAGRGRRASCTRRLGSSPRRTVFCRESSSPGARHGRDHPRLSVVGPCRVRGPPPTCRRDRGEPGPDGPDRPAVRRHCSVDDVASHKGRPRGEPEAGATAYAPYESGASLPAPEHQPPAKGPLGRLDDRPPHQVWCADITCLPMR